MPSYPRNYHILRAVQFSIDFMLNVAHSTCIQPCNFYIKHSNMRKLKKNNYKQETYSLYYAYSCAYLFTHDRKLTFSVGILQQLIVTRPFTQTFIQFSVWFDQMLFYLDFSEYIGHSANKEYADQKTYIRFCLSYAPLKRESFALKINIVSIKEHIVDKDVVNDVTCTRPSVITRVVTTYIRRYSLNNSDVI